MQIEINRERLITTLIELCSISSPSGAEEPAAGYILKEVEAAGFSWEKDETGNIYVSCLKGRGTPLFLSSHMDTVPLPEGKGVTVLRRGGRISSDGTTILGGDDKQGVAAALEMMRLCAEYPEEHRDLELLFTVQEERGSAGSARTEPERLKSRDGFNLDGETPPGTVIYKAPYKEKFICTVRGVSSHAALAPLEGLNAIVLASRIIARLPLGEPGPHSTSNVGVIHSGKQINVVPDTAVFEGELRSFSPDEFEKIREEFNGICAEEARLMGGEARIEWTLCYESYEVGPDENCCLWFNRACEDLGVEPRYTESRGGGDSNQLNNKGLRNLVFGLGMHNIHSVDEYVVEEEYCRGVELLARIVFPGGEVR